MIEENFSSFPFSLCIVVICGTGIACLLRVA